MDQLSNLNIGFDAVLLLLIDIYFSKLSSIVDKEASIGTQSFVSVITKDLSLFTSTVMQVDDQVRKRLISQLIKVISRVLQNLLKYFNGIAISFRDY